MTEIIHLIGDRGTASQCEVFERQIDMGRGLTRHRTVTWWNEHRSADPWSEWRDFDVKDVSYVIAHYPANPWRTHHKEAYSRILSTHQSSWHARAAIREVKETTRGRSMTRSKVRFEVVSVLEYRKRQQSAA